MNKFAKLHIASIVLLCIFFVVAMVGVFLLVDYRQVGLPLLVVGSVLGILTVPLCVYFQHKK